MALREPVPFNIKDLTLDVRLDTIVDGTHKDYTGKNIFSVGFFRKNIGFGITDIDIEVNTSLQPIITITFKDLYGNTVFGKTKDESPDSTTDDSVDFSALFNWPPPKFIFTFKGFLGKSATWMLNMKKTSVSYDSSDGSYNIKCDFVPNQWGFLSDLPFLYLLATKALRVKANPDLNNKVQSIFDLIKIGKQVEVKTTETTKEFDNILKQMTLLKSLRVYDSVFLSKVVNYDETINGQVGGQTIVPFNPITINSPKDPELDSPEKIRALTLSSENTTRLNTYLLLKAQIGGLAPANITYSQISTGPIEAAFRAAGITNLNAAKSERIKIIDENIQSIENAIKKKTYDSSKEQLEKITIGEIFKQLAQDSGYIMGRILEAGYQGYHNNQYYEIRKQNTGLIGNSFPLWITGDKKEEKPATKDNTDGIDFGVELYEGQFVSDFIDAISEGIATELAEEDGVNGANQNTTGDNFIKKRINNLEALRPNPYKPFYQNIAENILIRSGIAGYLTRSPDPNRPGDYRRLGGYGGADRATNAEDILPLANADFENITTQLISSLSSEDFRKLKTFCTFWENLLTEDCQNLRKPETSGDNKGKLVDGDSVSSYVSSPGQPLPIVNSQTILDYSVVTETPAGWDGVISPDNVLKGLQVTDLRRILSDIFRIKPSGATSVDSTNSNFIDLNILQSIKVVNNGIAYHKSPIAADKDGYVFVMFEGSDASKAQQIMSAESDSEIKNDLEEEKKEKNPLGFINLQSPYEKGNSGAYLPVVDNMNDNRIGNNLMLLDYSRLLNPDTAFFKNQNSLSGASYFYVLNKLGDPDNPAPGQIPTRNITLAIAYHPWDDINNSLVFGPFAGGSAEKDSLVQRGYIRAMCVKLKERLNEVEQKRSQVISEVLGKAGENKDLLYKQMHTLYQQWEVLITQDSDSANKQNTKSISPGAIVSDMSSRYSNHENFDLANALSDKISDNTFLYGYPLNIGSNSTKINVKNSLINIEPLYKPNGNTTILNIIQQICTKNSFIFIPMPGEPGCFSTGNWYEPNVTDEPKIKNFFYVQFVPTPESRSTLKNESYAPISSSEKAKSKLPDETLWIKFGSTENQIVKNISVDTQESKTTAESIINLQRLVDNENQNKKVTTDCSMLSVMEGRSYKATADMLGNAQIFPMQFFYLDSIPLFNGLYQIMKVRHTIKPNDMTTSAEGIRMRVDYQNGDFGGIPPITLESLANLPVQLIPNTNPVLGPGDFANAVADQGSGTQDSSTGTNSAGSNAQVNSSQVNKGGSDITPNNTVTTLGVVLPPDLKAVRNSIRLTQSSDANGPIQIQDFTDSSGVLYKKTDIIRNMNEFIEDVLGPFATFLKANYPHLYKKWYFTSATRSYVPTGGSGVSQHQKGQAVDSQIIGGKDVQETMKLNLELFNAMMTWYQQNPIGYDQILWETRKPDKSWIHWSYKRIKPRIQFIRFTDDKTNQSCTLNRINQYIPPGVTPSQIILTV